MQRFGMWVQDSRVWGLGFRGSGVSGELRPMVSGSCGSYGLGYTLIIPR